MSTLSFIVITYNEEKNIARCLESVSSIADEIIVIDSYSNDTTELICNQYNAKFIKRTFTNYADQRNVAFQLATMDYLFFLDADEALSVNLKNSLLQIKKSGMQHDIYKVHRFNNFCGKWIKHGMWYPEILMRMVKNGKGTWYGQVHETLQPTVGASVFLLKGDLLHYSYTNIESLVSKLNHYTSLQAVQMFEQNKKAPLFKLYINPIWAFTNGYFIKLGFLDGWEGYVIHRAIAFQTMIKYAKLRQLIAANHVNSSC
jgi:glycosyltransferase involved in cell wall biosynthesis